MKKKNITEYTKTIYVLSISFPYPETKVEFMIAQNT